MSFAKRGIKVKVEKTWEPVFDANPKAFCLRLSKNVNDVSIVAQRYTSAARGRGLTMVV